MNQYATIRLREVNMRVEDRASNNITLTSPIGDLRTTLANLDAEMPNRRPSHLEIAIILSEDVEKAPPGWRMMRALAAAPGVTGMIRSVGDADYSIAVGNEKIKGISGSIEVKPTGATLSVRALLLVSNTEGSRPSEAWDKIADRMQAAFQELRAVWYSEASGW